MKQITWVCDKYSEEKRTKKNKPTKPCKCGSTRWWKHETEKR